MLSSMKDVTKRKTSAAAAVINIRSQLLRASYGVLVPYAILWIIVFLEYRGHFFNVVPTAPATKKTIPIFYNLYVKDKSDSERVIAIVEEQFAKLRPVHGPVRVHSIGYKLTLPASLKFEHIAHHNEASELVTLHSLWEYCKANPFDKVGYLHSKGSFTPNPENTNLRRFLTKSVLSEECERMPSTCNVCSSRFSPVPHPHTSGNMWLARCNYVASLLDPYEFVVNTQRFATGGYESLACDGRDRYAAERWIHSHPTVAPCDVYPFPNFTWGYINIPDADTMPIELAAAPRFNLSTYVIWPGCPGRGMIKEQRLEEYQMLYHQSPGSSWWGWKLFEQPVSYPFYDLDWELLIPYMKKAAYDLGYSKEMWEESGTPFSIRGKSWNLLTSTQRSNLTRLGYGEQTWNKTIFEHTEEELVSIQTYVNRSKLDHDNFRHCRLKKGRNDSVFSKTERGNSASLSHSTTEKEKKKQKKRKGKKKRVLLIAALAKGVRQVVALWSQLECFTDTIDAVVISAPFWNAPIVDKIVEAARLTIPRFASGKVALRVAYFVNNRYDVGLWCDALQTIDLKSFDEVALINDSVFALSEVPAIFDELAARNVSMTSLSYSYSAKYFADYGPEFFWLESVFRGFDKDGIQTFMNYSCVSEEHPLFCPKKTGIDKKACIVDNFEHDLAKQFPCTKVYGLYPSDVPKSMVTDGETWIKNTHYWQILVEKFNFPVAKVNIAGAVGSPLHDDLLKKCTAHFNHTLLMDIDFSFGVPYYEQLWSNLPRDVQKLAMKVLRLDEETWAEGQYPPRLSEKRWRQMSSKERDALAKLGYSKVLWDFAS